jgi:hypothetical protein
MFKAEDYETQPIETKVLEWEIQDRDGEKMGLSLPVAIHPNSSGRIIINYPGTRGEIDGFNGKHRKLAQLMQGEGLGAVVRSANDLGRTHSSGVILLNHLRGMVEFGLEHSLEICGSSLPEIYLIGTSAGGSAVGIVGSEYSAVRRMLLMAPAADETDVEIRESLGKFEGEMHVVIGQNDEAVGPESGQLFYDWATKASTRSIHIIPDCNHQFHGTRNGLIMSQAPFYAFAQGERPLFPVENEGMVLY